jgi:hypothetical protein
LSAFALWEAAPWLLAALVSLAACLRWISLDHLIPGGQ